MEPSVDPHVVVNGRAHPLGDVGGHVTLLGWLRSRGFTGVKEGCAEGECGACAVLVARPAEPGADGWTSDGIGSEGSKSDGMGSDGAGSEGRGATCWTAVNACLVPAAGLDAQEVVTAEGLGRPEAMHPVQQRMADLGGSQCGFCTPGFVCSMASEYYRPGRIPTASGTSERAPEAEPGVDRERALLEQRSSNGGPLAPSHAPDHEHGPNGFDLHALSGNLCRCTGYRPIRDAAYGLGQPEADDPLQVRCSAPAPGPAATRISSERGSFLRPASLEEALQLLAEHPQAQLVAGSTDWGVELNIRHARAQVSIGIDRLDELRELAIGREHIDLGAALSLTEIERGLAGRVPLLAQLFPQFASRLIRNGATLGGNLGTGSPIGDAMPALLALDARLVLTSRSGEREVALCDYYTGYRRSVRRPDELIRTVRIPMPLAPATAFHKIAKRRFDDISSVAVAFAATLAPTDDGGYAVVQDIKIGLGGVAATPVRARDTEVALTGRTWSAVTVAEAAEVLGAEGTPLSDHRASGDYRSAMLDSALRKFHSETAPTTYQEA